MITGPFLCTFYYICRVQGLVASGQHQDVFDPTPDQLYKKRKFSVPNVEPQPDTSQKSTEEDITIPSSGWGRAIPAALEFDDVNIKKHSLNSGQRASKSSNLIAGNSKTCIRPETRGYQFYSEQYLHDILCQETEYKIFFKAKCFPSQKKNDTPHNLWCALNIHGNDVVAAHCSCIAALQAIATILWHYSTRSGNLPYLRPPLFLKTYRKHQNHKLGINPV